MTQTQQNTSIYIPDHAVDLFEEALNNPNFGKTDDGTHFIGWLKHDVGETFTFRMLDDRWRPRAILMHKSKEFGVLETPCLNDKWVTKIKGKQDCPWCDLGPIELKARGIYNRLVWLFHAYVYERDATTILAYHLPFDKGASTPLAGIGKTETDILKRSRGASRLTDYDIKVTKTQVKVEGRKFANNVFTVEPSPDYPFPTPDWTVPQLTDEEIVERYVGMMETFQAAKVKKAAAANGGPETIIEGALAEKDDYVL